MLSLNKMMIKEEVFEVLALFGSLSCSRTLWLGAGLFEENITPP